MSERSRRPLAPEKKSQKGPETPGKTSRSSGLSPLESSQMKKEITRNSQKIAELIQKDPAKAAKVLSDWINSAQSKNNSDFPPSKESLRRKSR